MFTAEDAKDAEEEFGFLRGSLRHFAVHQFANGDQGFSLSWNTARSLSSFGPITARQ